MLRPAPLVFLVAIPICTQVVPAQSAEETDSHAAKLEKSFQTWVDLKAKCDGDYSYSIRWSSWVGFGRETTLVARDGEIVERKYREWSGRPQPVEPGKPPKPDGTTWTEKGDQLGSHKKGAPVKTLDELYAEAKQVLERKLAPHERLYVRFNAQGLLQSCFYVDTRIADDAPTTGVTISSIQLEQK
jgi:hypothetical protein